MSKYTLTLLTLAFSLPAHAGFWSTTWQELISPVTTEARPYLLSGSALTAILTIDGIEDSLGHDIQDETVENKPLGEFSGVFDMAGQMVPNALYAGGMYAMYLYDGTDIYKSRSIHMLKSTIYAASVGTALKMIVREPRPDSDNRDSFPSGHTTTAFAFAAVVGTEHEWYWGASAYGVAALVAYSRINDNRHRLHDVVGGAVLGMSYGLSLHYLYKKKEGSPDVALVPFGDGMMLSVSGTF